MKRRFWLIVNALMLLTLIVKTEAWRIWADGYTALLDWIGSFIP